MALTRDDILGAALEILDTYGLPDLTMRRVASQLGVQAGALYWHVPNKQHLLSGLADLVLADLPALGDAAPADTVVARGLDLREVLLRHRSGAELLSAALSLRPWSESPGAALEAWLTARDVPADTARQLAAAAVHLVIGHVLDEEQRIASAALNVGEGPDAGSEDRLRRGLEMLARGALAC